MALNYYFKSRREHSTPSTPKEATVFLNSEATEGSDSVGSVTMKDSSQELDQFADASDNDGVEGGDAMERYPFTQNMEEDQESTKNATTLHEELDQFADAAEDSHYFPGVPVTALVGGPVTTTSHVSHIDIAQDLNRNFVRCGVLVRKPTQLFKILKKGGQPSLAAQEDARKMWLGQEASIRGVLNDLRSGEINLLVATSVVEEGVDVQACSFVLVFDTLKNIKSYIQMKGRARQKHAKFFVFQDINPSSKNTISLSTAQEMETRVHSFISTRSITPQDDHTVDLPEKRGLYQAGTICDELQAVEAGRDQTQNGTVSLLSAKSLINRFVMAQPMDHIVRYSKVALTAHLPLYKDHQLILPSYLSHALRVVDLPELYSGAPRKDRDNVMATMACVRLYKHGLLSDRLLPLSRNEIHSRIHQVSEIKLKAAVIPPRYNKGSRGIQATAVFVYQIYQESEAFAQFQQALGWRGQCIAIISLASLGEVQSYRHLHPQLGEVFCEVASARKTMCTESELDTLADFFAFTMNSRWRQRTRSSVFRKSATACDSIIPPYAVACVKASGEPDWDLMRRRLEEGKRDKKKRTAAVLTLSDKESLLAPRLWCPLYDTTATYIVYGPSGQLSNSLFPFEKEGVITYRDYFLTQHGYVVPANSQLFVAQRLWRLPSRQSNLSASNQKDCAPSHQDVDHRHRYPYCNGLASVKLSKDACFEPPLADSNVFLLITLIPQLLYCMERNLTVHAFIYHCKENLPVLGACLATLPIENVLEVLTASSCGEGESYEKLECDAVLKLIQTDSLIKSINLTIWIQNLHEGELTSLRSEMGSNKRLAELCRLLSIDRFILTSSLSRGLWTPSPLELSEQKRIVPPEKVCADVIEAILGLVYREEGYELALKVADELHLTVPWKDSEQVDGEMDASSPQLVEAAQHFTGYQQFRRSTLVEEAFTHPTSFHPVTSSYQRLEWIGDAVLCLAAREWLFYQFPDCPLGDLVIMEASLVANETLAYLSLRSGLQRHLNHRDQTLPARIETYHWNIREHGRGLWGTHPPKPIADVVESLLGAVHVDGGFVKGQEAALHVLLPICDLFRQIREPAALAKHPKQQLSELGGSLLSVTVWSEEVYARTKTNLVWRGRQFGAVQRNGHKKVASVQCLGVDLVTVLDASRSAATNRACAMVLATLERNPDLLDRFKSARSRIHSKAVESSKDDEPESESDA